MKNRKFAAMDDAIGEHGWKIVLLLRLSPLIPFNMSNYLYGLTAIRFWPYVLASVVGTLPANVLFVYLGAAGKAGLLRLENPQAPHSPLELTLLATGLVARGHQVEVFARFVEHQGALERLRCLDWAGFARRWNGPNFNRSRYAERLSAAYADAAAKFGLETPAMRSGCK